MKKIAAAIMIALMVGGCGTWKDTGSTVLTTTGGVLITAEKAYLDFAQNLLEQCKADIKCSPGETVEALYAGADALDSAATAWAVAYQVWDAGNQEGFYNALDCLVAAFSVMHNRLLATGFSVFEQEIAYAITAGRSLVRANGGVCEGL